MVIISPNVDFGKLSVMHLSNPDHRLHNLRDAFSIHDSSCVGTTSNMGIRIMDKDMSEWESDTEILWPRVTEDEVVPNGPDPAVPLIPREPDTHIHGRRQSEVEHLADAARPLPTQEKRRMRAAIGTSESVVEGMSNHRTSVGVVEIEGKEVVNVRKYAYYEVLLAAETTHLHNKPIDVNDAKQRPDWQKWKAAMHEELESLERHGTPTWQKGDQIQMGFQDETES